MEKVALIILHYNNLSDTLSCLFSLLQMKTKYEFEIIIVDNASEKAFPSEKAKDRDIQIHLIRNNTNLGFSGGNNVGIKYALEKKFDYILLLNNDTIVEKNFLDHMLHGIAFDPLIGAASSKIYFEKGSEYHKDRYKEKELGKVIWYAGGAMDWANCIGFHIGVDEVDIGQFDSSHYTDFATGACMLLKKEVLEKVGVFDEKYFLYYEDSDLCMRIKKAGYKIGFIPQAIVWHKNAGSSGGSGSVLHDYYITRNRLLFGFAYAPIRTKIALIKEALRIASSGRKWQKKAVIDFFTGSLGKGKYEA